MAGKSFSATATSVAAAIVFSFLLGSAPAVAAPALPAFPAPAPIDTTAYKPYSYVRFVDGQDSVKLTDEQFYDIAGKVIFPINKYYLPKNDSLILQLKNEVFPLINRDSLELAYMMLRGAASPEGPTRWNKILGERRAEALLNFVKLNLVVPVKEDLDMDIDIEDYRTLCIMMRRRGDKDYGYVQALCDQYLPKNQIAKLKATLRATRQGTLWFRLFREYFPQLRAARVIFFFRAPQSHKKPEVVEPIPVEPVTVEPAKVEPAPTTKDTATVVPVTPAPQPWMERYARRELLSVKTNLLGYVGYMPNYGRYCPIPNVAIEYYPLRGHFTYGASFDFPWWQHYWQHKYFQIRNYQLESRYYFRRGDIELRPEGQGAAYKGLYLQAYGNIAVFGICFDERRGWEGEVFGAGLGVGYVLPLGKREHWRMEFQLQVGFLYGGYDPYQWENPVNPAYQDHLYYYDWTQKPSFFKKRQYRFTWVGPTRIGITLSYDLLYRKARNKTNGIHTTDDTEPTKRYNPLVPYEKHQKGDRQ